MVEEVRAHMKEMLEVGAIHPSQSPWCNTIMLVRKKDWGLCFCTEFHKLNVWTKKDSYPLPHIQEAIESLIGAGYFSCQDLKTGFWQISMDKASKQYTAIMVGNLGFFKCEWMPFKLFNVPGTFQRLMQNCLGELNLMYCLIYLDDMIVFSKTEEEHLWCLHIVFKCFQEHNLKLKLSKCEFFHSEINYLGHHASKEGVQPSKENLKAVAEFTPPQTYTKILAFLGLVGHYHQFINGIHMRDKPLHENLSGEGAGKKNEWVLLTSDVQAAFEMLKKACFEAPMLTFADFDKPFLLETNASKLWLGTVLSQKQCDGWYHPIAYASWSLTVHGHNYHSTKQEFLALKWAITEQFQEYLCWKPFVVKTDNNPLAYILTTPSLDANWHCWVESLAGFTFSIKYQKGRENAVASALSHVGSKLDAEVVKSILDESL